jgi:hypothetical protein
MLPLETCPKMIGGGICMTLSREAIGLVSYIVTSLFLIFSHIKLYVCFMPFSSISRGPRLYPIYVQRSTKSRH